MREASPPKYKFVTLAKVADPRAPIVYGIVQPGPDVPNGVIFIQSRDVGGRLSLNALNRTSADIAGQYRRSRISTGDILFSLRGKIGDSSLVPPELEGANIARGVARIRVTEENDAEYIRYVLQGPDLQEIIAKAANGSTFREISIDALRKLLIPVLPLPDQRKIAQILRTWDEAIEKLEALRTAKVQRSCAIQRNLFGAEYRSNNRLCRARDLFEPVSERGRPDLPLLAVMQDHGIVRRDELDRRVVMPDGDTSTYKVVRPGDFVVSLRSFEGGLEYSNTVGLVSPAYTVLRTTENIFTEYYRADSSFGTNTSRQAMGGSP